MIVVRGSDGSSRFCDSGLQGADAFFATGQWELQIHRHPYMLFQHCYQPLTTYKQHKKLTDYVFSKAYVSFLDIDSKFLANCKQGFLLDSSTIPHFLHSLRRGQDICILVETLNSKTSVSCHLDSAMIWTGSYHSFLSIGSSTHTHIFQWHYNTFWCSLV